MSNVRPHAMLARVISVDPNEGEALVVEVDSQTLTAMNCVDCGPGSEVSAGSEVDIEFSCMAADDEDWEEIFSGNPEQECRLVPTGGWSYRAYGKLISIGTDGVVDCGICSLPSPVVTNDQRCIGSYIAFNIARLDACNNSAA